MINDECLVMNVELKDNSALSKAGWLKDAEG